MGGLTLTFHLAGINNQNFLMRDEETGSYWQQISGVAVSGPMAGRSLKLVSSDELTFALWKAEAPEGTVLDDDAAFRSKYAGKDWEVKMKKTPTVISHAQPGLAPRDLMLGIRAFGSARAYPFDEILQQKLILDHIAAEPVLAVVGPDNQSVRVFHAKLPSESRTPEFYRTADSQGFMMDDLTGSHWNFQGCAIDGRSKGTCLDRLDAIKDYWFDWRQYNPDTTVYRPRR